jgi:hypothetical protein
MSDIQTEGNGNASFGITGSALGTQLQSLLTTGGIEPGADASYQLCKVIYLYHPLGAKMVEMPLNIAQSQQRDISIPEGPEDKVRKAFQDEWKSLNADKHIFNTMRLSRIYGISAIVYGAEGVPTDRPIKPQDLPGLNIYFNVLDPLNTSGSLVLNQNPNSPDFQKHTSIAVSGQAYHRSRACVVSNEEPIYIAYTTSAFGFVGRSVYQRALFPLKSFVQSMITDDLVTRKAGVLVAMIKQAGAFVDKVTMGLIAVKRNFLKEAETGNVLSIGHEDKIESLNLQNVDTAMTTARKNILENIAASASMPALILNNETFAGGFGEGTEDAKGVARYIEGIRSEMQPLYDFFDRIVQFRAWNPDFYKTIQAEFPEYKDVPYLTAFYQWVNSFEAAWPSLLIEPESELVKVDEARIKAIVTAAEVMLPVLDPDNKASMVQWIQDNFNEQKLLFKHEMSLDIEALRNYVPPEPTAEPKPLDQLSRSDSVNTMPAPILAPEGSAGVVPVKPGVKMAFK